MLGSGKVLKLEGFSSTYKLGQNQICIKIYLHYFKPSTLPSRKKTLSRSRLVKFLSVNTVEGSNKFPCNTVSGTKTGEPCVFPWRFPDCSLLDPNGPCDDPQDKNKTPIERKGCIIFDSDQPWCSVKTYHNRFSMTIAYY